MRILEITHQHRNDFEAVMLCEHCGHKQKLGSGYHDQHYHTKVIPAMTCEQCKRNRAGEIPAEENPYGQVPVPA
jgi:hypothetical protein